MKSLVVYYSRTGTTKIVGDDLPNELGADVEEVIDKKKRSGSIGYIISGKDASQKKLTELEELKHDPTQYDVVIIGGPVWACKMAPAIRTYIENNKSKIKNCAVFMTCGSLKNEVLKEMQEAMGKNAIAKLGLETKEVRGKKHIEKLIKFVKVIQKNLK